MNEDERKLWIERIESYKSSGLTAVKWCEINNVSIYKLRHRITCLNFEIVEVEDRAIALKRVLVNVEWQMNDKIHNEPLEFGLNYQNETGGPAVPPDDEGAWVIIPWKIQGLYKF